MLAPSRLTQAHLLVFATKPTCSECGDHVRLLYIAASRSDPRAHQIATLPELRIASYALYITSLLSPQHTSATSFKSEIESPTES